MENKNYNLSGKWHDVRQTLMKAADADCELLYVVKFEAGTSLEYLRQH